MNVGPQALAGLAAIGVCTRWCVYGTILSNERAERFYYPLYLCLAWDLDCHAAIISFIALLHMVYTFWSLTKRWLLEPRFFPV